MLQTPGFQILRMGRKRNRLRVLIARIAALVPADYFQLDLAPAA